MLLGSKRCNALYRFNFNNRAADSAVLYLRLRIDLVFESLKSSGRTGLCDTVSIQRSAWCYTQNIDVLEYSFQNGGGGKTKRLTIVKNNDFQTFRKEKCEIEQ